MFKRSKMLGYSLATAVLVSGCSGGANSGGSIPTQLSTSTSSSVELASSQQRFNSSAQIGGTNGASTGVAYTNAIESDSPLAFYHLNDVTSVMSDATAHHLNGTFGSGVSHAGPVLTATGDVSSTFAGGAYDTSMFASAPINPMMQPPQTVTVEAWIRSAAVNSNVLIPIVAYGRASIGPAYELVLSNQNVLQFHVHTATGIVILNGSSQIQPNVTYHVAATFDGSVAAIYLNGQLESSRAASGQLSYANLGKYDGLGVGGSLDKGVPEFNGNIGEVAIYGSALAQTKLQNHYAVGLQPVTLNETARTTANLVDMLGVNTHFHYTGLTYDTQFTRLKQLLVDLGVRHIRDGLVDGAPQRYYDHLNELGNSGIRSTLITQFGQSPEFLTSYPARVAASFEAYEPPNESDLGYGPNWVAETRAFQKMLYTTVKSNPATAKYRVFGPGVSSSQQLLGDLSQYMDTGNFHEYFPGYNPGTDGYGSKSSYGIYGSIDWNMNVARIVDGKHDLAATETGYNYASGAVGNLPPDVGAKYLPRLFFEMFNRHIARAFVYQLCDWESEPYFQDGLISQNLVPKAPYYAMKNLIALLRDGRPLSKPGSLSYTLSGDLANVHHTLMQRGDGSFVLALWNETRSITPTQHSADGTRINVPVQNINLQVPSLPRSMTLQAFDATGNYTTSVPSSIGVSTQIPVTDAITLVQFSL